MPVMKRYTHQLSAVRNSLVANTVMTKREADDVMNHVFDLVIIDITSARSITDITNIVFAAVS